MTKERMRIVLAEWCGYSFDTEPDEFHGNFWLRNGDVILGGDCESNIKTTLAHLLPNYPEDLNSIHEAERRMNINQLAQYADELDKVCVPIHVCALTHWQSVIMSTAEQRAEALLRTLNLWEEDAK